MENQIMRRTRSGKLLGSVVTKKTVRETVEVVVTPYDSSTKEVVNRSTGVELDVISTSTSTSTNVNQKVEVISTTPWKSPVRRVTIDFGKQSEDQEMPAAEVEVVPVEEGKDEEEEERRKELRWRKEEEANEIETQQTRELIQDVEKQKQQELPEQAQPEKNAMNMEDNEDETQPASEVPPPPPPPPEEDKLHEEDEDDEEWFDVQDGPKEPSPPEPLPKKAKQTQNETDRDVTTPPRYEAPQKRDDEDTETTKKRKAPSGAKEVITKKIKASSSATKRKKKKARRSSGDIAADYRTYIYRVLKQVHPDLGISSKGMATVNSFLNEMYEKIGDEAARLSRYTDAKTLSARDIQDAVKMVLPGDLGKHAIAEGAKAISRYATY